MRMNQTAEMKRQLKVLEMQTLNLRIPRTELKTFKFMGDRKSR